MAIKILFQDEHLLAVDKPAGLLSVPGKNDQNNLLDTLRQSFPNVRLIHRLDMATSGIMLFALHHAAQKHLSTQFETRRIQKRYIARVEGQVISDHGDIEIPLICDWPNRPKQKICWLDGKSAHTQFIVLSRDSDSSLLALHPLTGRSHQLRVHCLAMGHPIRGDAFYCPNPLPPRLLLHAERIQFQHPHSEKPVTLQCPPGFD